MTPEQILGLILAVGPYPGGTPYSQTPVEKGSPPVVVSKHEDKGRTFDAWRSLGASEKRSKECAQRGNVRCSRPHYNTALRRWERPETFGEGLDRYWDISRAIASTKADAKVLEFATIVFKHESGMFRRDVHEGTNHKPFRSSTEHEDGGLAWGFGQIHWSTEPEVYIPVRGFKHITLGEMVGLGERATALSVAVPIARLSKIVPRCKGNPTCIFVGYGGTVSPKHPFIKARVASYATLRRLKKKDRELSEKIRGLLGIGENS